MNKDIQVPLTGNHENNLTVIENSHSDEIDAIITKVPLWILRWGIVLFAGILLMALSIASLIRYPETIKAPVRFEAAKSKPAPVFTGFIKITENNINRIKLGQRVLIRLKAYPAAQYRPLKGRIAYIADEPDEHQLFDLKVRLENNSSFKLKKWMTGDAEIITQDVTVLQRIYLNLTKNIHSNP